MTSAPFWSTFTLCTEIVITILVLYIFYSGYKKNRFPYVLTAIALGYEILFNISYMVSRSLSHVAADAAKTDTDTPLQTGLAIFHGTLSLLMFIALVVFFVLAWKNYRKKINYFKKQKSLMTVFIIFWLLAVISGIVFYFLIYS